MRSMRFMRKYSINHKTGFLKKWREAILLLIVLIYFIVVQLKIDSLKLCDPGFRILK